MRSLEYKEGETIKNCELQDALPHKYKNLPARNHHHRTVTLGVKNKKKCTHAHSLFSLKLHKFATGAHHTKKIRNVIWTMLKQQKHAASAMMGSIYRGEMELHGKSLASSRVVAGSGSELWSTLSNNQPEESQRGRFGKFSGCAACYSMACNSPKMVCVNWPWKSISSFHAAFIEKKRPCSSPKYTFYPGIHCNACTNCSAAISCVCAGKF